MDALGSLQNDLAKTKAQLGGEPQPLIRNQTDGGHGGSQKRCGQLHNSVQAGFSGSI